MNRSEAVFKQLKKNRLIALLTPESVEECVVAYEILNKKGVTLEVAFRSEYAIEGIKAILRKYPEALVLAGTVMTPGCRRSGAGRRQRRSLPSNSAG